jgi:hypothetical protein
MASIGALAVRSGRAFGVTPSTINGRSLLDICRFVVPIGRHSACRLNYERPEGSFDIVS